MLFVNNYQDDPVDTTIECENKTLFGGNAVSLPARRGLILPLDWQPRPGVTVHYLTSEVVDIADDGSVITVKTAQDEFFAELSLSGYRCTRPASAGAHRLTLHGAQGLLELTRLP